MERVVEVGVLAFPATRVAGRLAGPSCLKVTRDCEKLNEAQVQGWIVLRVFPETLRTAETIDLIKRAFAFRNTA